MKWKQPAVRVGPLVGVASVFLTIAGVAGAAAIMGCLPSSRGVPVVALAGAEAPPLRVVHRYPGGTQNQRGAAVPAPQPEQAEYVRVGMGGVLGGLLGEQVGSGNGRDGETVVGLLGGYAHNQQADRAR